MRGRRWRLLAVVVALAAGQLLITSESAGAVLTRPVSTEAQYLDALTDPCAEPVVIEVQSNISLSSGMEPLFTQACDLTINGNGHTLNGRNNSRSVVGYTGVGNLAVNDVNAINGVTPDDGGDLTEEGGAIATGPLTLSLAVNDSSFRNNNATDDGGAINSESPDTTILRSSFVNNSAGPGGAGPGGGAIWMVSDPGTKIIANSTFYGNSATNTFGGIGIGDSHPTTLAYLTFRANSAPNTGANLDTNNSTELFGVTLSAPQGGPPNCLIVAGATSDYTHSTDASCAIAGGTGNVNNAPNPQLGAIDGGWWGSLPVMVPAASSPLVNRIPPAACPNEFPTDARGVDRPNGTRCDIGAVERDVTPPVVKVTGVMNGGSYLDTAIPTAGCSTTDPVSGVKTPATVSVSGPASGEGEYTATCSGAVDNEGNTAAPVQATYFVVDDPSDDWYGMVETDGTVYTFPSDKHVGNAALNPGEAAVDFVINTDGTGYYVLTNAGRVVPIGPGSTGQGNLDPAILQPGEMVEAMALTDTGDGYWIFSSRGRAAPFGDAPNIGDVTNLPLQAPVVDAAPYPPGFYMTGGDGGVFTPPQFANSQQVPFLGSVPGVLQPGQSLNQPIVTIYVDSDGFGYSLAAADGGMFNFDSLFCGSVPGVLAPGQVLNQPVVNAVPWGECYLFFAADGGAFNFAPDEPFLGSLGGNPPDTPIVSGDAYFA